MQKCCGNSLLPYACSWPSTQRWFLVVAHKVCWKVCLTASLASISRHRWLANSTHGFPLKASCTGKSFAVPEF